MNNVQSHTKIRVFLAILALALGGFGIGATEFSAMGLLPEITKDLLRHEYALNQEAALGTASWFVTAYAAGVVVGAPLLVILAARLNYKTALLAFCALFATATIATVYAPSFQAAVLFRFLAALPHGAYFGVAPLLAAKLLGPNKRGAGVAYVLLGLSVCNLLGVPLIIRLGQVISWQVAYLTIAAIFAGALAAIWFTIPRSAGVFAPLAVHTQLAAFKSLVLWLAVLVPAIGIAGYFAFYSYISPLLTEVTGVPLGTVALALAVAGCGMTVGNLLGGKLADKNPRLFLGVSVLAFGCSLLFLAFSSGSLPALLLFVFLSSISTSAACPCAQVWLMDIAASAPVLGGALVQSAFNVANALGAFGGGLVVGAGYGFVSPIYFGIGCALFGLALYMLVFTLTKQRPATPSL